MDEYESYSVENFVSFQPESYFRLFERQFETFWPLHILLFALGLAAAVFAWTGRKPRVVSMLLGVSFIAVTVCFQFRLYAELTPVGRIFGWAFLLEALLILLWGFITRFDKPRVPAIAQWIGLSLAGFGLVLYPVMTVVVGDRSWKGAEYFGLAPDPTVCAVLGILLISARPVWLLVLMPIPLLWAAVSAATLRVLEGPTLQLFVVLAFALLAALIRVLGSRTGDDLPVS